MATSKHKLTEKNVITCPRCNGSGVIRVKEWTWRGQELAEKPCPDCEGTGEIYVQPVGQAVERRR